MDAIDIDLIRKKRETFKHSILSKAEVCRLITVYQSPETSAAEKGKAANTIIIHNQKLVASVLKRMVFRPSSNITADDLFQQGIMGLYQAIEKFDTSRDVEFSTYAVHWIYQSMSRYALGRDGNVRIPYHIRQTAGQIKNYLDECQKQDLPTPTHEQIKSYLFKRNTRPTSDKTIYTAMRVIAGTEISLDNRRQFEGMDDGDLYEVLESPDIAQTVAENVDRAAFVGKILDEILDPREATVIKMRFGIDQYDRGVQYTLGEIGCRFGITRERIRQIEKEALGKLEQKVKQGREYI